MLVSPRISARRREQGQQQTLFQSTSFPFILEAGKIIMGVKNSHQIYEPVSKIHAVSRFSSLHFNFLSSHSFHNKKGKSQSNLIISYAFLDSVSSKWGLFTAYRCKNIPPTEIRNLKKIQRMKKQSKSKTLHTFKISELVDLKYNKNFVHIYFYFIQVS